MDLGYVPGPLTVYRHVRKLPPAHCAVYDLDSRSFDRRRYWRLPPPAETLRSEQAAEEELEGLLRDAVRLRLESDVPVGIFLSGGLDSSLVAAMAVRENPDLVAYTVRFPIARYDESAFAERVAEWVGIRHRILPVEAADSCALADLSLRIDEPFGDSSLLPTYLVSRAIRRHVKVALSGDGGDELFAGYGYYGVLRDEAFWDRVPGPMRALLSSAHVLLPVGTRGKNFLRRLGKGGIRRFLQATHRPEAAPCCPLADTVSRRLRRIPADGYRRSMLEDLGSRTDQAPSLSLLQQMTRLDFSCYLPDDILAKVDRASMLCSLEVRSPLLDYRVVEFAFSLPDWLRLNGTMRKYLLAKIARRYLPPDFPFDRKQGFSIPEAEWLAGEWRGLLNDVFREKSSLLDPQKVARIRRLHDRTGRFGPVLFRILMLAQFERHYGVALDGV
jgi:asparagine synthase (glutamine-hydrolysing)